MLLRRHCFAHFTAGILKSLKFHSIFLFLLVILSISGSAQIGTGGTITTYTEGSTIYVVHTFTSNGTFVPPSGVTSVEYLVVAGGGGGG